MSKQAGSTKARAGSTKPKPKPGAGAGSSKRRSASDPDAAKGGNSSAQGGDTVTGKEASPVGAQVTSPNPDPGKPPASAARHRRTNSEREAEIAKRDLEAATAKADIAKQTAEQIEKIRREESEGAKPLFAIGFSGAFAMIGRIKSRKLPMPEKAKIQSLYKMTTDDVGDVAYRTARVVHKWVGLEWIKYIDEEAMLVLALIKLADKIGDAEERILREIKSQKSLAGADSATAATTSGTTKPVPPPPPVHKETGLSGEDTSEYEFDDIVAVK